MKHVPLTSNAASGDVLPVERAAEADRLLTRLLLGLVALLGAHFLLTLVDPNPVNLGLAILGLALFPPVSVALYLTRKGQRQFAAILLVGVMLVGSFVAQLIWPLAAPIVALLPIAVVAIALPTLNKVGARWTAIAALLTILALRINYELTNLAGGPILYNLSGVISTTLLGGMALSMLTSFRSRTETALARAEASAAGLRSARDELETRVQERTRELETELTRSRQITDRLRLLESVAVNASDAIMIIEAQPTTGPGRNIIYANRAFTRMTGYGVEEALGHPLRLLRSAETSSAALERLRIGVETGAAVDVEILNQRQDGVSFWADQNVVPVFSDDGALQHFVVIMRDITEQRALRDSLSRRNQFLEALHEAALGMMNRRGRGDILGRILDHLCFLAGTEHGSIDLVSSDPDVGVTTAVATGVFKGAMNMQVRRAEGLLGKVVATGKRVVVDDYAHWPERVSHPSLDLLSGVVGTPLISNGVVIGMIGLGFTDAGKSLSPELLDLTDRFAALAAVAVDNARLFGEARAERDLATQITNSMGQGLAVADASGRLEYLNPTLVAWLGHEDVAVLSGQPLSALFLTGERDSLGLSAASLLSGDQLTLERRIRRVDGSVLVALVSLAPRFRTGTPDGVIAVFTDLTAIKQTEAALEQARDRAQEASRLKSEFLAMMSHEIRTPLNAILGMNELLLDTPLAAKQREMAQIAFESSQALMLVINDILDFSRIEAGKLELLREPFNVAETVSKAAGLLRRKAEEKGLFLDVRLGRNLPVIALGDSGRLRQVLINLIGNSLKFTTVGGVVVTADVVDWQPGSAQVRFVVQDTGMGLSDSIRERLFEPFMQAVSFMTRRHGGTGLGLAISKRIVEQMHGQIHADGAPGDGATFSFTALFDVPPEV